jgi:hypothetical protein
MNRNQIISIFILLSFLILFSSQVSAQSEFLGTFPAGQCVTLRQLCSTCNSSVFISSVVFPNSTTSSAVNITMAKNGIEYTYDFCNTTMLDNYIVNGGSEGQPPFAYRFTITPDGATYNPIKVTVYILFLISICVLLFFSFRLIINHPLAKDGFDDRQMYQIKKKNEFVFYVELLKKKLWMVGVFGTYLSLVGLIGILNQLCYILGLVTLSNILNIIFIVVAWGLVPFCIFWLAWLIIYFYKGAENILKYELGGFRSDGGFKQ